MKTKPDPHYDAYTKNKIKDRVCLMNEEELIDREYNRGIKRDVLIREWMEAGFMKRPDLREHLDECIRLVDFEIGMIHSVMKKRGIKTWDESLHTAFKKITRPKLEDLTDDDFEI
jgi:hypothetical protein